MSFPRQRKSGRLKDFFTSEYQSIIHLDAKNQALNEPKTPKKSCFDLLMTSGTT